MPLRKIRREGDDTGDIPFCTLFWNAILVTDGKIDIGLLGYIATRKVKLMRGPQFVRRSFSMPCLYSS